MKRWIIGWVLGLVASSLQAADRPNIILILADDMGFSDIGCYGGEIDTPNLDQLGKEGVRFTQFYNSARCCPTRASLMTGLEPHETGIGHMTQTPNTKIDHGKIEAFPSYQGYLNQNCMTIAEVLGSAGYATLMTGKWHLGYDDEKICWPMQRGFEKYYGCISGATKFFEPEGKRNIYLGNDAVKKYTSTTDRRYYTTDAFTDYAMKFIDEEKKGQARPFFLYLAYTAPHWPLHAHQEEVQKYAGKYMMGWDELRKQRLENQRKIGLIDPARKLSDRSTDFAWDSLDENKKKEMDLRMAYYAAMVDRMDQNIGRLVAALKEKGLYENTLIVFLSDNGGCAEGGKMGGNTNPFDTEKWNNTYGAGPSYGEVWANASNTPFRKFKHYTHEGGISTPLIAHWPKGIQHPDRWYMEPAYLLDLMPTFIELAGATYPKEYKGHKIKQLGGVSLTPSFSNTSLKREKPICLEHENNAMIRMGDWKLVGTNVSVPEGPDESKWELYNIKDDRTEMNDLAASHPEKVKQLAALWEEWAEKATVYPKPEKKKTSKKK